MYSMTSIHFLRLLTPESMGRQQKKIESPANDTLLSVPDEALIGISGAPRTNTSRREDVQKRRDLLRVEWRKSVEGRF
ncbi:hypothetical protein JTE90_003725 [Oedothorax gibbosus]|uniref:Uncharacterized protein n=1 Tax=Oedothorax gibbosus TaxID=931172 RepID=A0AAV6VC94_9ARAC|nr:hypothetical protein JTE90_003725 [Oedothorax gibbosus]